MKAWLDTVEEQLLDFPHWRSYVENAESVEGLTYALACVSEELGECYRLLTREIQSRNNSNNTSEQWLDEIGDLWWTLIAFTFFARKRFGFTYSEMIVHNFNKLNKRYKDGHI